MPLLVTPSGTMGPMGLGAARTFLAALFADTQTPVQPGLPTAESGAGTVPKRPPCSPSPPPCLPHRPVELPEACLGTDSSLPTCYWDWAGAGLHVLVFRQCCPRSCVHFIPFLAETPGCRNKPAAALPDVASLPSPFLRRRQPLGAFSQHPPALPEVPGASSVPKGRAFGC